MLGWNEDIKRQLGSCGENVYIGHNVLINQPLRVHLGSNVRIDPFTLITAGLWAGNNVQICSHAVLGGGSQHTILLEDWTFVGYGSKLFCASEDYTGTYGPVNEFWGTPNKIYRGNIRFRPFSGVASDVIVLPGVNLPGGCTIGAKSLVHSKAQLLRWSVYYGTPLTFQRLRSREGVLRGAEQAVASGRAAKPLWEPQCK